ncbi:MAG: hypothetical protein V4565_14705 [Bacteroidota bacterium]
MTREEIFELIEKIDDPVKDYQKIISNLHYTHYNLMDYYKKSLEIYDLTPMQSNVLSIIHYHQPKSLSLEEIKSMVLEPGSDVSRIVLRSSEKGFVEKVQNASNNRKLAIAITNKGLDVMKRISEDHSFNNLTHNFTLAEAEAFVLLLKKLRVS